MTRTWTQEELAAIAQDKKLFISIPNSDGSMHAPTWISIVQTGEDLYCRAYNGSSSRWYRAAQNIGHGHISVGGVDAEVDFEFPIDTAVIDRVDDAYRIKYADSPYLQPILGAGPRAATVRLIPAR
ncbi:DUF2255 family protein [Rhodococcus sp. ACT016]|uniref:DUF2255 family protein n=1 Tax=Rhodococcus sp. ACT016 TaxID=3134808 RepID=UPI003D2BE9FD